MPPNGLTTAMLRDLRAYYRALGDANRLRIVQLLATEGERSVSDLGRRLRISQPLLSWHLARLKRAGLVRTARAGREVRCWFDHDRFAALHQRGYRTLLNRSAGG
jgi:ArsR family transcriptional regulator, arsenate/arsenite/antimonite-responsive transcriptional repressor